MIVFGDAPYHSEKAVRRQMDKVLHSMGIDHSDLNKNAPGCHKCLRSFADHIYADLTFIDGKVGSLTQASGSLLVFATIILSLNGASGWLSFLSISTLFVAVLLSVSAVYIFWYDIEQQKEPIDACFDLLKIRNGRTRRYRTGWLMTYLGAILIVCWFLTTSPSVSEIIKNVQLPDLTFITSVK